MTNDEQLMLAFQAGSQDAFTELFERYRQPVFGYFRRRLDDPTRAEDLAQETFVAVLRAAARYEPRALFRTYLYAIASRLLAAERRKSAAKPGENGDGSEVAATGGSEASLFLRRAVEKLEPDFREALMLREYEELSYEEISQLLRIPVNTVRSRLFRARMALKQLLAPVQKDIQAEKDMRHSS
ncbi:MAG: RNA polymerase sigma factor [Candidatus Acidiferrales bacterium]